jgi:uncharacterized YccA/Bax inhibitor family protein
MRTANPALTNETFQPAYTAGAPTMTINGTVHKTAFLLMLVMVPAMWVWNMAMQNPPTAVPWMIGGLIGGLVVALVTCFKKEWSPVTAPLYALAEGLFVGGISAFYQQQFQGIVLQAAMLTFGTLFALLAAYRSGWIKCTQNFRLGVVAATGGIAFVYLLSMILRMFGVNMSFMYDASLLSIGISVFVVIIAALNLVLDFDFIEGGSEVGAPKYMEWYAAFGLLVTLIWLYLEILRLLAKLSSRRN